MIPRPPPLVGKVNIDELEACPPHSLCCQACHKHVLDPLNVTVVPHDAPLRSLQSNSDAITTRMRKLLTGNELPLICSRSREAEAYKTVQLRRSDIHRQPFS